MRHTERLIEAYERHAIERDEGKPQEFKQKEKCTFLELLGASQAQSLLEVGCGPGADSVYFQDHGLDVLAIDNTPAMVALCRRKGVSARVLDCYHLSQLDREFDAVYSMNCLLHIPRCDLDGILEQIRDLLRDGGLFYLGLWTGDGFEGIWEDDQYEPKRFFSFHRPRDLLERLLRFFTLVYYRRIEPGEAHFCSTILRC